jgi:hypothetical protein
MFCVPVIQGWLLNCTHGIHRYRGLAICALVLRASFTFINLAVSICNITIIVTYYILDTVHASFMGMLTVGKVNVAICVNDRSMVNAEGVRTIKSITCVTFAHKFILGPTMDA